MELGEFFGEKYETLDEIISAGEKLRKMGSENVIISLGKNGSVLVTKNGVWVGNVPKGTLVSSVGAGDSMVAGTIYGITKGMKLEEAYRYGIASGSATAFSEGLTTFKNMEELLNDIIIKNQGRNNNAE